MAQAKTIGFVCLDGYADRKWGLLSASAVEWFGARAVALSPDGGPVHGIGGFASSPERAADPAVIAILDSVAVISSDGWATAGAPDISGLLADIEARGGVLGGICAGTLPLARAGLLAGRSSHLQRARVDRHACARLPRRGSLSGCAAGRPRRALGHRPGLGAGHIRDCFPGGALPRTR